AWRCGLRFAFPRSFVALLLPLSARPCVFAVALSRRGFVVPRSVPTGVLLRSLHGAVGVSLPFVRFRGSFARTRSFAAYASTSVFVPSGCRFLVPPCCVCVRVGVFVCTCCVCGCMFL